MGLLRWVARGQAWTNQLLAAFNPARGNVVWSPQFLRLFEQRASAIRQGEPFTTLDLLTCLVAEREVQRAIVGAGLPLVNLTRTIAAERTVASLDINAETLACNLILAQARWHVGAAGHRIVTPCDVLVRLANAKLPAAEADGADEEDAMQAYRALDASAAVRVLRASGLDVDALLWFLAHGANASRSSIGWLARRRMRWQLRAGMHHVIMHNDDYTSRDFVVYVLQQHFGFDVTASQQLMQKVHRTGLASVAILPLLQATEQMRATMAYAREQKFPFRLSLYPETNVALAVARHA